MANKIIIEDVKLGDSGEMSKDKINSNFKKVSNSIDAIDTEVLAVSNALKDYAKKEDVVIGMLNKGSVASIENLPIDSEKGNAYYVENEGFIYQYDGSQWNKTAFTTFPSDVATINDVSKLEGDINYSIRILDYKSISIEENYRMDSGWGVRVSTLKDNKLFFTTKGSNSNTVDLLAGQGYDIPRNALLYYKRSTNEIIVSMDSRFQSFDDYILLADSYDGIITRGYFYAFANRQHINAVQGNVDNVQKNVEDVNNNINSSIRLSDYSKLLITENYIGSATVRITFIAPLNIYYTIPGSSPNTISFTEDTIFDIPHNSLMYIDKVNNIPIVTASNELMSSDEYILLADVHIGIIVNGYFSYFRNRQAIKSLTDTIDNRPTVNYDNIMMAIQRQGHPQRPEQSLIGFLEVIKQGFKIIECAVRWTSDNVPVLLHDDTINRTARNKNGSEIAEPIRINSITYEQTLQYEWGYYYGYKFHADSPYLGTDLMKLEDFIILCKQSDCMPLIEIKSEVIHLTDTEQWELICALTKKYGMQNKTYFNISRVGLAVNTIIPLIKNPIISFGISSITQSWVDNIIAFKDDCKEVYLNTHVDSYNESDSAVQSAITNNIPIICWGDPTDNTSKVIQLSQTAVRGVVTNTQLAGKVIYNSTIGKK